jgi:hypothetical protein
MLSDPRCNLGLCSALPHQVVCGHSSVIGALIKGVTPVKG